MGSNSEMERHVEFSMDGYCVWDPSLVADADGRWHLFFSRWPIGEGFEAWVTHSEVCRALAESPLGPFRFEQVVLPRRPDAWDGDVTHNPTVRRFGERYYLYYTGNRGDGDWWTHRNHQRVGLAVADRPEGPWRRFDQPLLDVAPGRWDAIVTTNPTCTQMPDGRFLLLYKGVGGALPAPGYGPVLHGAAFGDAPDGPFERRPEPILAAAGAAFPGEDPHVWCESGRCFALLKDMGTHYSSSERAIVRFESTDGLDWRPADPVVFHDRTLAGPDGRPRIVDRLERPFLCTGSDRQEVFFCAVKPNRETEESFIAAIPLSDAASAGE